MCDRGETAKTKLLRLNVNVIKIESTGRILRNMHGAKPDTQTVSFVRKAIWFGGLVAGVRP